MKKTLFLLLLALLPGLAAHAADPAASNARGNNLNMPLRIVATSQWIYPGFDDPTAYPVATVGCLGTDQDIPWWFYGPVPRASSNMPPPPGTPAPRLNGQGVSGQVLSDMASGSLVLQRPRAQVPTLVYLVGPQVDASTDWMPVSITRDGSTITVFVQEWDSNDPRPTGPACRPAYLLSLGKLDPGKYTLRIDWSERFMDAAVSQYYQPILASSGSVGFTLLPHEDRGARTSSPVSVGLADLKPAAVPPGEQGRFFQRVDPVARIVQDYQSNGSMRHLVKLLTPGLSVGTFDFDSWVKQSPGPSIDYEAPPALSPATPHVPLYAVVIGPRLNSGEWMALRDIEWKGKDRAIIHVQVWRDNGLRKRNTPFFPLLVSPLDLPGRLLDSGFKINPGSYNISIDWQVLMAPKEGGLYSESSEKVELGTGSKESVTVQIPLQIESEK